MERKKQGFVLPIENWIIKKNKSHILSLFDKKKITKEHNEDFALVITSSIFIIILLIFINSFTIAGSE